MSRLTAKDFAPELLELYDFYAHGIIDRREFLSRASRFAAGGLSAAALLAAMSPDYALAEQVSFTDPDIHAEYLTYPSPRPASWRWRPMGSVPRAATPATTTGAESCSSRLIPRN
jgi:hypothetical protein